MSETNYTTITSNKSKKTTLILCICLGFFGIHDFYLCKIGKGLIKLITFNWFAIGYIIDIIKVASGNYLDAVGQPIRR